ncbi:MAG: SdrD B-like domain-containing protein [Ilumatobacter sp.]
MSIGDVVWQDLDNSGRLEFGEPPIADVVVELLDGAGAVAATTLTDLGGKYRFHELQPGTYRVRIPAANFAPGRALDVFFPSDGPFANQNEGTQGNSDGRISPSGVESGDVTLADGTELRDAGSFDDSVDFGFYSLGVAATVWSDDDRDGFRDERERGIPRVIGRLLDRNGAPVLDPFTGISVTAVTGADGVLAFRGLAEGDYIVDLPSDNFVLGNTLHDHVSSAVTNLSADGGTDDDDNGVPLDGGVRSGVFRLEAGMERSGRGTVEDTVDFGMVKLAAVGRRVWRDDDRDGREDEPGVAGVRVELIAGGQVRGTATTDGGGNYLFASLEPGTYSIRFVTASLPAGFATTLVDVGDDRLDSDAGPDGLVSDIVLDTGEVDRSIDLGVYQGPVGELTPLLPATGGSTILGVAAGGMTLLGMALLMVAAGDRRRRPTVG